MYYKYKKSTAILYSVVLIALLVFLDQLTKLFAVNNLKGADDIIIIPSVFQLHYLENTGAAFSMLEGKQLLFSILTPIMLIIMLYILIKMPLEKKFAALDYIIIFTMAGAIGNYIDRVSNKYVVDFLYFSLINFPVFNVADCYVTCSVILLIILIIFYYKDEDFEEIVSSLKIKK